MTREIVNNNWLELSITAPAEYVEPLSVIFQRYGHGGVVIEQLGGYNPDEGDDVDNISDAILRVYLPVDSTTESRKQQIKVAVDLISRLCTLSPIYEKILDEDEWMESWKDHFSLIKVGRVVICPTWMDYQPIGEELVMRIDPGMAFGTGHHPTTHMCLAEIEDLITLGANVLDLGTGSGILSIAAAMLGADNVLALDTDPSAVRIASENFRLNEVDNVAYAVNGTLSVVEEPLGVFDLIVANIYTKVILEVAQALVANLSRQGRLVVSGIMADRSKEVESCFKDYGYAVLKKCIEGDWAMLVIGKVGHPGA